MLCCPFLICFSWRMTISLTSRTISTRSPAIVEPGIAESGWTNRDRERVRPVFGSLVPEHSCAKACYILTIQLISCSELRKKSSLSVTWKTRLYSQQEPKLWRVNFWCHNLLQMSSKVLDLLESFVLIKKFTSAKSTSTVSSYNKLTLAAIDPFDIYQNNWSYSISILLD